MNAARTLLTSYTCGGDGVMTAALETLLHVLPRGSPSSRRLARSRAGEPRPLPAAVAPLRVNVTCAVDLHVFKRCTLSDKIVVSQWLIAGRQ